MGSIFNRVATWLVSTVWYTFAFVLVTVALSLSILRYTLPQIDKYQSHIHAYLAENYAIDVSFASLDARWTSAGPSLNIRQLAIQPLAMPATSSDTAAKPPFRFIINDLAIDVNILKVIQELAFYPEKFQLNGAQLDIDLRPHESTTKDQSAQFDLVSLQRLLLKHLRYFSLNDTQVNLTTTHEPLAFYLPQLTWVNNADVHRAKGALSAAKGSLNAADLLVDLRGGLERLDGTIYLAANAFQAGPLLASVLPPTVNIEADINGQVWINIAANQLTSVQAKMTPSAIKLMHNAVTLPLEMQDIHLQVIPQDNQWRGVLNINDMVMQAKGSDSEAHLHRIQSQLLFAVDHDLHWRIHLPAALVIDDFAPIVNIVLGEHRLSHTSAVLQQLDLASQAQWSGSVLVDNIRNTANQRTPGISDLTLQWQGVDDWHRLTLTAKPQTIDMQALYGRNFDLQDFSADVPLLFTAGEWQIRAAELAIATAQLAIQAQASYRSSDNVLSYQLSSTGLPSANIGALLSDRLVGPQTLSYLRTALNPAGQQGQVSKINSVFEGAIDHFPFSDHSGLAQTDIHLNDTLFAFSPRWLPLHFQQAVVSFVNEDLLINSPQAHLGEVALSNLQANIAGLRADSVLNLSGQAQASGDALTAVFQHSSIADSLGKILSKNIGLQGELATTLQLSMPLNDEQAIVVTGETHLAGNTVTFKDLNLPLYNTVGKIAFRNEQIDISGLTGELYQQPVELDFHGQQMDVYRAQFQLRGAWQMPLTASELFPELAPLLSGQFTWQADGQMSFPTDDLAYEVTLTSDLHAVRSRIPPPFTKLSDAAMPLRIHGQGDLFASTFTASLGEDITFKGQLPHSEGQFSRAHLAIGPTDFAGLGNGFSISAELPEMLLFPWYETISLFLDSPARSDKPLLTTPERLFVHTDNLIIKGHQVPDANLVAKRKDDHWQFDIESDLAKASIFMGPNWLREGLTIDADHLRLQAWQGQERDSPLILRLSQLPPLDVTCHDCQILNYDLGKVHLIGQAVDNVYHFSTVRSEHKDGRFDGQLSWIFDEQGTNAQTATQLSGQLRSKEFGDYLEHYQVTTGIKDAGATFDLALNWHGDPFDLNLQSLNGEVKFDFSEGYIADLSDQGSNILGLFSLPSLVRKLSLDFRDVFAKGFFFSDIDGTLQIKNGIASTQNTKIDGAGGKINIAGYSDLVAQQLNYQIAFAPNVTGNLPVLVYFMASPVTAVASLAVGEVLNSAEVFAKISYNVTGTFEQPIITELERSKKTVELNATSSQ